VIFETFFFSFHLLSLLRSKINSGINLKSLKSQSNQKKIKIKTHFLYQEKRKKKEKKKEKKKVFGFIS